jgi:hypothetical protein
MSLDTLDDVPIRLYLTLLDKHPRHNEINSVSRNESQLHLTCFKPVLASSQANLVKTVLSDVLF